MKVRKKEESSTQPKKSTKKWFIKDYDSLDYIDIWICYKLKLLNIFQNKKYSSVYNLIKIDPKTGELFYRLEDRKVIDTESDIIAFKVSDLSQFFTNKLWDILLSDNPSIKLSKKLLLEKELNEMIFNKYLDGCKRTIINFI